MILATTPPIVSMPSDNGVTSSSSISFTPPSRMSACTAAPSATTSSGFSSVCGWRAKNSSTVRRTSGTRELRVRQGLPHWGHGALDNGANQTIVFSSRNFAEIYAAIGQGKFHGGLVRFGKLVLGGDQ